MNHATITPTDNGPYLVQGEVTLLDAKGNAYESTDTIALCRCGLSATKPFCDGSHEKTHFKAINRAPTTPAPIGSLALASTSDSRQEREALVDLIAT